MSAGLCQTSKQHVQVSVTALDPGRWVDVQVVVVFAAHLCIYMRNTACTAFSALDSEYYPLPFAAQLSVKPCQSILPIPMHRTMQ